MVDRTLKEVAEELKNDKRRFGDCSTEDIMDQIRNCEIILTATYQFNVVDLVYNQEAPGYKFFNGIL